MTIIQEGNNYKSQGNIFRDKIDTLRQNNDSVFEDFYINAIKKYREVNHYKDSISKGVYMNAKDQIKQVEIILDSAYNLFILKADTMRMKEYDQIEAAEVFENRAKKIEPYINIDNNNNEEMHKVTNSSLRSCYANKYMGAVCRHLQKRGDKHEKRKIQGSYQVL